MKRNDCPRPSDDEAIEATAAAWLAQRDDGLSTVDKADFAQWRAADARHEKAAARLETTWATLQQLRDFRPEARLHPDRDLLRTRSTVRRVRPFPATAAAALAASLVLAAAWWYTGSGHVAELPPHRYATTADGYERVVLEDGSLLELNSSSEVTVQFTPAARRVRLVRGEAHFTVAKNQERPFMVEAGAVAVRAVGTAFNVRLGPSDVEVLVTEGKVEVGSEVDRVVPNAVSEARNPAQARWGQRAPPSGTFLIANERAVVPIAAMKAISPPVVERLAPEAVRAALAWQGPRLVFVDTPLAEAVAQFNRRSHVQLVLADAELESLPIGGSFRPENVDAFVRLLAAGNDIVAEQTDPARIVLRKGK
ncbi:MAG: FecR domain-containing protein [Opitutaceae bacterium]|nr:FecR domain-containing protein [Opitutaceae bacterium]